MNIDAPRIPAAVSESHLPPVSAAKGTPAEECVTAMHAAIAEARAAIDDVYDNRPGGAAFLLATAEGDEKALTRLIQGDAARVARALVLTASLEGRLHTLREEAAPVLLDAAAQVAVRIEETRAEVEELAVVAWERRDDVEGRQALERVDALHTGVKPLLGLSRWALGQDARYNGNVPLTVSKACHGSLWAARDYRAGGKQMPPAGALLPRGWRAAEGAVLLSEGARTYVN